MPLKSGKKKSIQNSDSAASFHFVEYFDHINEHFSELWSHLKSADCAAVVSGVEKFELTFDFAMSFM